MVDSMLAQFLNVALDIQQTPAYAGIRVTGGTLAASDGVILVAFKLNSEYIRGEGMIPPATARRLTKHTSMYSRLLFLRSCFSGRS